MLLVVVKLFLETLETEFGLSSWLCTKPTYFLGEAPVLRSHTSKQNTM